MYTNRPAPTANITGDKNNKNHPNGRISSRAAISKIAKPALKNTTAVRK